MFGARLRQDVAKDDKSMGHHSQHRDKIWVHPTTRGSRSQRHLEPDDQAQQSPRETEVLVLNHNAQDEGGTSQRQLDRVSSQPGIHTASGGLGVRAAPAQLHGASGEPSPRFGERTGIEEVYSGGPV